jgi:hypothetical protein
MIAIELFLPTALLSARQATAVQSGALSQCSDKHYDSSDDDA